MSIATFPKAREQDYQVLRASLESGDLLLCSGTRMFSRLIKKFTKSDWSHVAFVIRLKAIDRVMVLESVESVGVRTVPLSTYLIDYSGSGRGYSGGMVLARHTDLANKLADDSEVLSYLIQSAVDLLGYPYDKDEILRIAGRIVFGDQQDPTRDREYICSEFVHECYKRVGIDIPFNRKGYIAPADFASQAKVNLVGVLKST